MQKQLQIHRSPLPWKEGMFTILPPSSISHISTKFPFTTFWVILLTDKHHTHTPTHIQKDRQTESEWERERERESAWKPQYTGSTAVGHAVTVGGGRHRVCSNWFSWDTTPEATCVYTARSHAVTSVMEFSDEDDVTADDRKRSLSVAN